MRLYQLPDGWEDFSVQMLQAKLDEIRVLSSKVTDETLDLPADPDNGTVSGLDYAEALRDAKLAVQTRLDEKTADQAETEARRAAVLADLTDDPEPETVDDDGDDESDSEPAEEPVEAALADETPEPEPVPESVPEPAAPAAPATVEPVTAADNTPAPRPASEALRAMNARRGPDEQPRPAPTTTRAGRMRTTGELSADGNWTPGDLLEDLDGLSTYVSKKLRGMSGNWDGPRTKLALVSSQVEFDDDMVLHSSDIEHNYGVFARNERQYQEMQLEALVAAGAPCAPLMPTYDFETCYSVQRPIEQGVPVVGAPRGGIRFLDQVPLNEESADAVTVKDATASAILPDGEGYVAKNCTRVSCPTETEVTVAAVSWCVTFDNLGFRVFPEQVRNMLERVAIEFAKRKEIYYLNRIDELAGAAVSPAAASPFGTGRSLFADLVTAGHNYRKRNNMNRDSILDVWLPDVVEESLAVDMVNDPNMSAVGTIVAGPNGNLTQVLAQRARFNVNWYYYDADAEGFPLSAHDGAADAWNPLPTQIRSYIHAPGAIQRLDAGQLDLGVVRDSTLNADNDLQLFAEQWVEVAKPGCELVAIDHDICYSGVGPIHVDAPACPAPGGGGGGGGGGGAGGGGGGGS